MMTFTKVDDSATIFALYTQRGKSSLMLFTWQIIINKRFGKVICLLTHYEIYLTILNGRQ